ncbi:MAG: hypothetical protein PHU85_17560, partial [Phycisphaerae bacterium]|nr:hypothetical protein [Phycisphaerae bacterium]
MMISSRTRRAAACLLLAGLLTACVHVRSSPVEDYIGPRLDAGKGHDVPTPTNQPGTTQPAASQPEPVRRVEPPATGALRLTVTSAVLLALQNNKALAVDRVNPAISRTFEQQ